DSFFDLGGHSLLATRLVNRIRSVLGVEVPIQRVFDAPTVAALSGVVGSELLAGSVVRAPLVPMVRSEWVPLSFAQRRLWFLHRFEGLSATYNVPCVLRLSGVLDVVALQRAVGDVVGRHESLRTLFVEVDGEPVQRVVGAVDAMVPVSVVEVGIEAVEQEIVRQVRYEFDLAVELPVRASVIQGGASEQVLVLVLHHIAADGWSMAPLLGDLAVAYAARCVGEVPDWDELPVQYADYTLWQRELLGDEGDPDSVLSTQFRYWREELADLPAQLQLPTDRPRPRVSSYRGDVVKFEINASTRAAVESLSREQGATASMVLQSVFAVLLSKISASQDIPIGSPIAGRLDEALSDLVGFFVNTWVLRVDVSGNPRFDEVLAQVRGKALAAYANQDVPFEKLVELVNPVRSTSWHPLFQAFFVLQNNAIGELDFPGLQVREEFVSTGTSRFDLLFNFSEVASDGSRGGGGYDCLVEYATDLFDQVTVEQFVARFIQLLEQALGDPATPVRDLDVLLPGESRQLLDGWNDTAVPMPRTTIVDMFEQQAAATADAVAVIDGDRKLTYRQLNARADRLAEHLAEHGVGPDTVVAVALLRSADLIVALLAVLKAGGAYLPIDPAYPSARNGYILTDAAPLLIITDTATDSDTVLPDSAIPRLHIDRISTTNSSAHPARHTAVHPDNLAYVIYTSGSTGRPKGVMISHR
ncbi:condensation domain-containing protein, partial [Mycolicibacterium neoaurum]|uniref:condensation domain-containing protein n=1 Tax=Mycolicibacterium neoaurum TaxID=1795 RepID=UPI001F4CB540